MSQTTTPPNAPDHGCSCGRPDCQYDKAWGNPLRETQSEPKDKHCGAKLNICAVMVRDATDAEKHRIANQHAFPLVDRLKCRSESDQARTAVAELLTRESALVARNAELAAELAARDARLKIPRNPIERYLFDALKQYPSKNPQRTQAAKVCVGVIKLACEMAENDFENWP